MFIPQEGGTQFSKFKRGKSKQKGGGGANPGGNYELNETLKYIQNKVN